MAVLLFGALAGLLALLPTAGAARELEFGLSTTQEYDSNVTNASSDEVDEFVLRLQPRITFSERQGSLRWRLRYTPSYEVFYSETDLNTFNHFLNLNLDYQIGVVTIQAGFA